MISRPTWIALGILALLYAVVLALLPHAFAQQASGVSCSAAADNPADGNVRYWYVATSGTTANTQLASPARCPSDTILVDMRAGATILFTCWEQHVGSVPVSDSTQVIIRGYWDNDNFNAFGTGFAWEKRFTTCPDLAAGTNLTGSGNTFTETFTADGASGAARYGILRIQVRACDTTATSPDCSGAVVYDVNSDGPASGGDTQTVGIVRGDPRPTAFSFTSPQNPWIGGDTATASLTLNSGPGGVSGNTGSQATICAPITNGALSQAWNTSASTNPVAILGSKGVWQTGCTLKAQATLTETSAISVYAGTDFTLWDQSSPPANVAFPSSKIAVFTSNTLNRILTPSGPCVVTVDGNAGTVANEGSGIQTASCGPWTDARGNNVPNNEFARAFVERVTDRDTTDATSFDGQFGSSGSFPTAHTISQTATTTTGLAYHRETETFSTNARTDAVLKNWGNTTGIMDVSSTLHFAGVNLSFTNPPTTANNRSTFTVGSDLYFGKTFGLAEVGGALYQSANVTCQETHPDLVTTEPVIPMGTTDASGNSAAKQIENPTLGPPGKWTMDCSVTFRGNTGTYHISYFHTSPVTSNTALFLTWKYRPNGTMTLSGAINVEDPTTSFLPTLQSPDDPNDFQFLLIARECDGCPSYAIANGAMNKSATELIWRANVTIPQNQTEESYLIAKAWTNFTGKTFLETIQPLTTFHGNSSGNFTGNVTFLEVNGMITTAWDTYVPLIVWGTLSLLFAYYTAWAPLVASVLALVDTLLPTPVMNFPGRVILLFVLLLVHVAATSGVWGKTFGPREDR
jgi:hypothetical protein